MGNFNQKSLVLALTMFLGEGIFNLPLVRRAVAAETPAAIVVPEVKVRPERETPGYAAPTGTTGTKTDVPLRDVPQAVNVITRELIEDQGALSAKDALRNVPGLTIQGGEGGTTSDTFTLRGFRSSTDIFLDGVRDDGDYFRDLSNIERIEVLKGPASVLYGRGSSGGLVNFVTRTPQAAPVRAFELNYGSFDSKRASADFAGPLGDAALSYRLTGAIESSQSHRDSYFLDRKTVAPAVAWQPNADTRVLLQGEYLDDKRLWDGGIPSVGGRPASVPINTFYGSPNDELRNELGRGTLTLEHRLSPAWSVRNVLRYTNLDTDGIRTIPRGVRSVGGVLRVDRSDLLSNRKKDALFNQLEAVHRADYAGLSHVLLIGVELGRQKNDSKAISRAVASAPLFNPAPFVHAPFGAPTSSSVAESDILGVYVQDQVSLSKHWKALVGLRYDSFDTEVRNRIANTTLSRKDSAWSPRGGLVWQPTDASAFYANYSRSFQPSAENLFLNAANVVLEPESTTGYETGAKLDFLGGQLTTNVALFRLERENIRTTDPADPTRQVNAGVQRTNGLELEVSGRIAPGWNVYGGYALLDSRIVKSNTVTGGIPLQGKRPLNTPRHSVSLWSTYKLASGFGFGGGLRHVGERFGRDDNTITLPSYVVLDAALFYEQKGYGVALNLANLTDKVYYESVNFVGQSAFPGAPRSVMLTLRLKF